MSDLDQVTRWIDAYVSAWNTNDPEAIGALFTDDAVYTTDGKGGNRRLDIGSPDSFDNFGAVGAHKVTWTNRGTKHTVALP